MASTSEKGHAKNIANLNLLIGHITALENTYNPSNPNLTLSNLQNIYNKALQKQNEVNNLLSPYSLAVNDREEAFKALSKKVTKLRKLYKSSEGVTFAELENFMTIARKLKGIQKTTNPQTADNQQEQKHHSSSQMSFDQRTNNFAQLIALLNSTSGYNPNEEEFKIGTLENYKQSMLQKTQAVADTFVPLNTARSLRNAIMYNDQENLVEIASKTKDYLFAVLDTHSAQYKAISKLKFFKIG